MADLSDTPRPARRRRSDAQRSIGAILGAARTVLSERPEATMEDVAIAAGVTRQTVYAHFSSRDVLIAALIESARLQGFADLDAAGLGAAPPVDALRRLLEAGWELVRRYPFLSDPAFNRAPRIDGSDPHLPVAHLLERLIRRGQGTGDFDRALPADWLAAAILELGHTAAEQVHIGHLAVSEAPAVLLESSLRLCGATGVTDPADRPDPIPDQGTHRR
jgi:AcrR family transcriptional regulator